MHGRIGCVILALSAGVATAEETAVPACLVQVARPEYSPLATLTRITGAVRVDFRVNTEGDIDSSKILEGHPQLVRPITELLRRAKLDPASCGGKEFSVAYEFSLDEPVSGLNEETKYSFREPNVFVVRKRPLTPSGCSYPAVSPPRVTWRARLRKMFR